MLTPESSLVTQEEGKGSDALRLLAYGSPVGRTLEAAAAIAASIENDIGCGILLVSDDRLVLAASHGMQHADRRLLNRLCLLPINDCLAALSLHHSSEMRPLVTAAAELIGAVVLFYPISSPTGTRVGNQLDEVCAVATLAIEGKHLSDELYFRAHHDALTQLWNRLWMEEEIARVLDDSLETGFATGLLLIGIDSFRIINELLGSQVGNELLRHVAIRLTSGLKPGWSLARCGGDEFLVLIPDLASSDQVAEAASHLLASFDRPFEIGDHELLIRATVGTSFTGPGECRSDGLQNRVETALRYGKRRARGRVSPFAPSMISTPPERLEMERHLRFALRKREFEIYYQPQVHLQSGKLIGAEALLRWRHPSLGFISPGTFVPIAEQIGIIDEVGEWVTAEAIRQLEVWHAAGLDDLRIAVNVSALQFAKGDLASIVARLLRKSKIKPAHLELEITESVVMTDFEHGARQLKLLRSLGVLTALDDFGTGHSSLAYLQQLPIQRLKIDRMFVKDIVSETGCHPLLSSIIQMGRALGCSVIAEGIETAEQALALSTLRCEEVQGFFFSKPLPANEFLKWAKAR